MTSQLNLRAKQGRQSSKTTLITTTKVGGRGERTTAKIASINTTTTKTISFSNSLSRVTRAAVVVQKRPARGARPSIRLDTIIYHYTPDTMANTHVIQYT